MDKDKIEDRKRPAGGSDDGAPPRKKVAVNGGGAAKDDFENRPENDWIETFAKGAIYRRMQEYKREAAMYSARLEELHKRSLYHDDHLRIVDSWWRQLLEEIELLVDSTVPEEVISPDPPYLSSVSFKDSRDLSHHLEDRAKSIKSKAESLIRRIAGTSRDRDSRVAELESNVAKLLAAQKDIMVRHDRLSSENHNTTEQLNAATLRYFKAEKKLDRARSAQVQKLEQQALANDTKQSAPAPEKTNRENSEPAGNNAELLQKYEEECAAVSRMKEQVQAVQEEIKALQDENSTLKARREAVTDEDFIRTEVFKLFKSKNEELITKLNHLEATNATLRDEVEKLNAERTSFKRQLEADAQALTQDLDADLLARDHDLARVRSARDELLAENTMRKSSQEQQKLALDQMRELLSAKDDRIAALESEVGRLRPADDQNMEDADSELEQLSAKELIDRYRTLQKNYEAVSNELPSMEKALKKNSALAHKKVMDLDAMEARNSMLIAEKTKADQKYFAARKDADTKINEVRQLRMQNSRSTEIIAQLKDTETQSRGLVANLEKQLADLRTANMAIATENKKMEAAAGEASRSTEGLKKEISDLKALLKTRDASMAAMRERSMVNEVEADRLRIRVDSVQKDRNDWKVKAESNSSDVEKGLRTLMICSICNENFKNTALKTCGHLFCSKCVENRINNRMRKCPSCSRAFDKMDVLSVHH